MRCAVVAVIALAGCGRIDFGALSIDGAPGSFVISATQLTTFKPSYVDLEVDWTHQLAYAGTRETGHCVDVIDFAGSPAFLTRLDPPATSGGLCLGVSLDPPAAKLEISSSAGGTIERWDLGADPRLGAYTQLAVVGINDPRRITRRFDDPSKMYVALGKQPAGFAVVAESAGPPWIALGQTYGSAMACPDEQDQVLDLASNVVVEACQTNNSPIEVVDDTTLTVVSDFPATIAGESGFDSVAVSPDGNLAVALGWVSMVIDTSNRATMRARFDNDGGYRDSRFIDRGNGPEVVAIRNDDAIDILSLADPANPVVIASGMLGVTAEAYAVEVSPDLQRAIVVTNSGWFLILDLTKLPVTQFAWPSF